MSVHLLFPVLTNLSESAIPANNLQTSIKSLVSHYEVLEYIYIYIYALDDKHKSKYSRSDFINEDMIT